MSTASPQSYPFHAIRKRRQTVDYPVLAEFRHHLEMDRGVRASGKHVAAATCFLDFLRDRGIPIEAVSRREIDDFITDQGAHYRPKTVAELASYLRSFFRFLLVRGVLIEDWARAVARPRVFNGKRDPRYLKPADVQRILSAVDHGSPIGNRDYAILTMVGLYGLRGGEVAHLGLDDIGWRSMVLRIRKRKCGDAIELPLLPVAAFAVVDYLGVAPRTTRSR